MPEFLAVLFVAVDPEDAESLSLCCQQLLLRLVCQLRRYHQWCLELLAMSAKRLNVWVLRRNLASGLPRHVPGERTKVIECMLWDVYVSHATAGGLLLLQCRRLCPIAGFQG